MWLKAAAISLLTTLSSYVKGPTCPGLVKGPEPRHEVWNIKYAKVLAHEIQEADQGKGFELLFYGDSITEQWRGTDQGGVCTRCTGDQEIFRKYFGRYTSDVLAVGGDQIGHLLWRLMHGDIPTIHHPKVAVVMIGINDLGAAAECSKGDTDFITQAAGGVVKRCQFLIVETAVSGNVVSGSEAAAPVANKLAGLSGCGKLKEQICLVKGSIFTGGRIHTGSSVKLPTLRRLTETIQLLQARLPDTQLLMLALLPRGDGSTAETAFQWPGRYTKPIEIINQWLQLQAFLADNITFLDCGADLLQDGKIDPSIQVDGLHPSPAGMDIMARCISPAVEKLMEMSSPKSLLTNVTVA